MRLRLAECPTCSGIVVDIFQRYYTEAQRALAKKGLPTVAASKMKRLYPEAGARFPPKEVTNEEIRKDYSEACATKTTSLRAAAALARRALQGALREHGFKARTLENEIDKAGDDPRMTSTLRDKLHFVRKVGNDTAHPNLDHAGEIVDVEPEDFTMMVETLDEFFDVFYVRPARHMATMAAHAARKKRPQGGGRRG